MPPANPLRPDTQGVRSGRLSNAIPEHIFGGAGCQVALAALCAMSAPPAPGPTVGAPVLSGAQGESA